MTCPRCGSTLDANQSDLGDVVVYCENGCGYTRWTGQRWPAVDSPRPDPLQRGAA